MKMMLDQPYALRIPEDDFRTIELDLKDVDEALGDSFIAPSEVEVHATVPSRNIKAALGKIGAQLDITKEYDSFSKRLSISKADITVQETNGLPDGYPSPPHTILKKDPNISLWKQYNNGLLVRELLPSEIVRSVLHRFKRPTKSTKNLLDEPHPKEDVIIDTLIDQFLKDSHYPTISTSYRFGGNGIDQEITFTRERDKRRTTKRSLGVRSTHVRAGSRYEQSLKVESVISQPRKSKDKSSARVTWKALRENENMIDGVHNLEEYLYTTSEAVKTIQAHIARSNSR